MATVFLGLGSNLGNRQSFIEETLLRLVTPPNLRLTAVSQLYETAPVGNEDQPMFLNAVCQCETAMSPASLLLGIRQVETALGRMRTGPWTPRTIDIDILFYNGCILNTPDLTIPHPRLYQRRFVLVPLAEIAPDWICPLTGRTVRNLLAACPDRHDVDLYGALHLSAESGL